jgi:muramoyltetrapeptide carboxypeptidase
MIRPAMVPPGGRVALVAPAGPLPEGALERAVARVRSLGWTPEVGPNASNRRGFLAGTDDERLLDLTAAFESSTNDAIWLLRGGYGTMRLLPRLRWSPLLERPRPLIGYSDNTALHLAARRLDLVTFHGPHPAARDLSDYSLDVLSGVLGGGSGASVFPPPPSGAAPVATIAEGTAEGPLVGGNLSLLAATMGTPFQVDARGAILFLEEVGEPAYRLDRLFSQLLLAGVFDDVAGIAVGAITECPDSGADDIPSPVRIVADRLGNLGVPIAAGFPFGHVANSWTLPLGVPARLDASAGRLTLLEPAVAS